MGVIRQKGDKRDTIQVRTEIRGSTRLCSRSQPGNDPSVPAEIQPRHNGARGWPSVLVCTLQPPDAPNPAKDCWRSEGCGLAARVGNWEQD